MAAFLYLRVDFTESGSIGPHRAGILEGIARLGSISATARVIGRSSRQVWTTVQALNEMYPHPVISTKSGSKGGATLTPFGEQLLKHYRAMERDANKAVAQHLNAFQRLMGEDPAAPIAVPKVEGVVLWPEPPEDEGDKPPRGGTDPKSAATKSPALKPEIDAADHGMPRSAG